MPAKSSQSDDSSSSLQSPKALVALLAQCKRDRRRKVACAFVPGASGKPDLFVLHAKLDGRRLLAQLCTEAGVKGGTAGEAWLEEDEDVLMLKLAKLSAGLEKKVLTVVKQTGFRIERVKLADDEASPAPAAAAADPSSAFNTRLGALLLALKDVAPEVATAFKPKAREAGLLAGKKDFAAANVLLDQAEGTLRGKAPTTDLLDQHVKRIQASVDQHIVDFRADLAVIDIFLGRWQPLPASHQFVANRMARLRPELDAFLQKARGLALLAGSSRSALAQVEKDLKWYTTSPDAQALLKQTALACGTTYDHDLDGALRSTERTTLGESCQADEDFFAKYLDTSRPPLTVYRGDGRGVTKDSLKGYSRQPILAGGTRDVSFFGVIQHLESSTNKNGMVSTTTDRTQAIDWALDGKKHGLLYTMKVSRYIDTNDLLRKRNFKHRFPAQLEILVPDQIPASEIVSVELLQSDKTLLDSA